MPIRHLSSALPSVLAGAWAFADGPAHAADKFKVTGVECEMFWMSKHTPVMHYDIVDERRSDYEAEGRIEDIRLGEPALTRAEITLTGVRPLFVRTSWLWDRIPRLKTGSRRISGPPLD